MKKRLTAALLALIVVLSAMPNAGALLSGFSKTRTYRNQFSDVSTSSWYYDTVKTAYELGIFNGTSDTKFSPNKTLNADEMTALLARIHAAYYGNTITENANGSWAEKYYAYVTSHIDSGYRNSLNSKTAVTRLDFAYWMSKALPDKEYTAINTVPSGQIYDLEQSNTQRANRVYLLYRAGILSGNDKYGTFAPQSSITRVQVAAIISRMIDPSQRQRFTLKQHTNADDAYLNGMNLLSNGDFVGALEALYRYKSLNPSTDADNAIKTALNRLSLSAVISASGQPKAQFTDATAADYSDARTAYVYLVLTDRQTGKKQVAASIRTNYASHFGFNNDSIKMVKNTDDSWLFYVWTGEGNTSTFLYTLHTNQVKTLESGITNWDFKGEYIIGETMTFGVGERADLFIYNWSGNLLHSRKIVASHTLEGNYVYFVESENGSGTTTYYVRRMELGRYTPATLCTIQLRNGTSYLWMESGTVKWQDLSTHTEHSMNIHSPYDVSL